MRRRLLRSGPESRLPLDLACLVNRSSSSVPVHRPVPGAAPVAGRPDRALDRPAPGRSHPVPTRRRVVGPIGKGYRVRPEAGSRNRIRGCRRSMSRISFHTPLDVALSLAKREEVGGAESRTTTRSAGDGTSEVPDAVGVFRTARTSGGRIRRDAGTRITRHGSHGDAEARPRPRGRPSGEDLGRLRRGPGATGGRWEADAGGWVPLARPEIHDRRTARAGATPADRRRPALALRSAKPLPGNVLYRHMCCRY